MGILIILCIFAIIGFTIYKFVDRETFKKMKFLSLILLAIFFLFVLMIVNFHLNNH